MPGKCQGHIPSRSVSWAGVLCLGTGRGTGMLCLGTGMLCPGTSHLFKHQHSKGGFCKQRGIPGLSQPCSLALPQPQDEPSVTGVGQQSRLLSQASGCLENLCKELRPARPRKRVIPRAELLPAVSGGRRIVLKPQ